MPLITGVANGYGVSAAEVKVGHCEGLIMTVPGLALIIYRVYLFIL